MQNLMILFIFSFIVALTGAMSPGPLFTYTIIKTIQTHKHSYLMGAWIIVGHALLEFTLIAVLLLGLAPILSNPTVLKGIGVVGCGLLLFFGITLLRDLKQNKIPTEFLAKKDNSIPKEPTGEKSRGIDNPIVGGIVVSMSNPYWWFWWAAIGFTFMVQFNVSFSNISGLISFFLGHEMGDLSWYVLVSILVSLGKKAFNKKVYYGILAACGIFMIGFGLYLGISPFISGF
jgi:threonine/homoserine/homoserine lactone efflux protein